MYGVVLANVHRFRVITDFRMSLLSCTNLEVHKGLTIMIIIMYRDEFTVKFLHSSFCYTKSQLCSIIQFDFDWHFSLKVGCLPHCPS